MKHQRLLLSLLFTFIFCATALAQFALPPAVTHLKSGTIQQLPPFQQWVDSFNTSPAKTPVVVLLQFSTMPRAAEKELLKSEGIDLLEYLPVNTYVARISKGVQKANLATVPIVGIAAMDTKWKIGSAVASLVESGADSMVTVLLSFYSTTTQTEIQAFLVANNLEQVYSGMEPYRMYKVKIAAKRISQIAQWFGIQSIDIATGLVDLDQQSRPAVKGNFSVSPIQYGGYNLFGDSVTVGVGDNAPAIYHADTKDRVLNFNPYKMSNHGAHVSGIVGGAGTVDVLGEGMAPHTTLINYLYDQILANTGTMFYDHNMTITNNSYAVLLGDCNYAGTYDGYTRFLDSLALQFPNVLHVFASGNDGWMRCSNFPSGFATIAGGYNPAKNNLLVGSMTTRYSPAPDESKGPTKDGRLKPEIIAIGLDAYSTIAVDTYKWAAGTSMASPQVAGGLATITQLYKRLYRSQPSAELLKAIILAGATDGGNIGPDFTYGFGRLNVGRALKIVDNQHFYSSSVNNGAATTRTIVVPSGTAQLKVLVTWHDKPASTLAATQLVNDLDLTITDPIGGVHLPLVPDNRPDSVNVPATLKADHLNNTEEVVINNPPAGNYVVNVNGYSVPFGPQSFSVAYDVLPSGIALTFPIGGEGIQSTDSFTIYDSVRVFWDAVSNGNTFKVEFSSDSGLSWQTLAANVPADIHYLSFRPYSINSGNCFVRLSRNGTSETVTSGRFAINQKPVLQLDAAQCPGYINLHWEKVPNASGYLMYIKNGPYLQLKGATTDTNYTFSGLPLHEKAYVAMQPVLSGIKGYRSNSAIVVPDHGNCANPISAGDLMLESVVRPGTGRLLTSTQLSATETIVLKARNLSSTPATNYSVAYSVNGGSWTNATALPVIAGNDTAYVNITGFNASDTLSYNVTVAIVNRAITDPVTSNDTISFTVKQLPNNPVQLPFLEGFEGADSMMVMHDSVGITRAGRWDFLTHSTTGRLRTFVNNRITIAGRRSVSLDDDRSIANGSNNMLVGTFNLSTFDTGTHEIRLDFNYLLHGMPKAAAGNLLSARVNDATNWQPSFTYDLNAYGGQVKRATSISLTDIARNAGKNFSTSFQLCFGQNDTSLIADRGFGNGLTIDNVQLYIVTNDAALLSVQSPSPVNCGLTGPQPLIVEIRNGVNNTLYNVNVFYRWDSGTVYSGIIDFIPPKSNLNYTFTQPLTLALGSSHFADIWISAPGDSYSLNDSLLHVDFRNNEVISAFPYLENFEAGTAGYYTGGTNSSWQYGKPTSAAINKAASGTKAWKTNLNGKYNNQEQSYLYSPCFNLAGLGNPMLSFSAAIDVEDCGDVLCDKAFVEYSYNGTYWRRLGSSGSGVNWYDSTHQAWTRNGFTRWHVASIPLNTTGGSTISLRFGLISDPGASFEGFAVDDIHIFDAVNAIAPATDSPITVVNDIAGNNYANFLTGSGIVGAISPSLQALSQTSLTLFKHDTLSNYGGSQYIVPRSYKVLLPFLPADSIVLRLFIADSEIVRLVADTSCPTCTPVTDAYRMGITRYSNPFGNDNLNHLLTDDTGSGFSFIPPAQVNWVPYFNGYYGSVKAAANSEFWFNNGGPAANATANTDPLAFFVYRNGGNAEIYWRSYFNNLVDTYFVERSIDGISFSPIADTLATVRDTQRYKMEDNIYILSSNNVYYRLRYTLRGNKRIWYSPVRKLNWDAGESNGIHFTAELVSDRSVSAHWVSYVDPIVDRYLLERSINSGPSSIVATVPSSRVFSQNYAALDPIGTQKDGTVVQYRLIALLETGDTLATPTETIIWSGPNTVGIVYPNPCTGGQLNVLYYSPAGTLFEAGIYDMSGKRLLEYKGQATQYSNVATISLPSLPAGTYVVRTLTNGAKQAFKFVVP